MNTTLIQALKIARFRGLYGLNVDDLSRINVFVGLNNSGKTSVLEAIKILSAPKDIGQLVTVALHRSGAGSEKKRKNLVNYLLSIFHQEPDKDEVEEKVYSIQMSMTMGNHQYNYEADGTLGDIITSVGEHYQALDIAIKTSVDSGKYAYTTNRIINEQENVFEAKERPVVNALYMSSSVNYYQSCAKFLSSYILREGKADIMQILQSFDSNIEDISILGDDIYLYNSTSGSLPLFAYGVGLQKAVLLTALVAYTQDGVLLIDEIDNAIHISAFENVFSWFIKACKEYNVQAFVSTHSAEAIDAIIRITSKISTTEDILRVFTLRKDGKSNITRCKKRNGQDALRDREQFGMELRV